MKIFKTKTSKIVILIFIFALTFNTFVYASYNPPREEVEAMIDEAAVKRAVPSVLLKSIARVESVFKQFNDDGSPKITGNCIGLMMINNNKGAYDSNKLRYDIKYNIEAGIDVLLNKWSMSSYKSVSSVGNMDPNVLENWYFALWAYNGWAASNNPHMLPSYVKKYTYQQMVYNIAIKEYNQQINNIDFAYLPQEGKPSRSLVVPTPAYTNLGGIILYDIGDFIITDGVRGVYNLRDAPAGKYIYDLAPNTLGTIIEGPVLQNGYYWYKISINDNTEGWIERNWLLRTGDAEYGEYVFQDIAFTWARKNIMDLFKRGIVSEAVNFNPNDNISKEEFCILLSKTIDKYNLVLNKELEKDPDKEADQIKEQEAKLQTVQTQDQTLPFTDTDKINSWAIEHINNLYSKGLLNSYTGEFKPYADFTRVEAAMLLSKIFDENPEHEKLDIKVIFNDLNELSENEKEAIKSTYTAGLMSGKGAANFHPYDNLTRAESAAIMAKLINKVENK